MSQSVRDYGLRKQYTTISMFLKSSKYMSVYATHLKNSTQNNPYLE